LKVESLSV